LVGKKVENNLLVVVINAHYKLKYKLTPSAERIAKWSHQISQETKDAKKALLQR
jgi:hypothetical protein